MVQQFTCPDIAVGADAAVGEGPVFDRRTGNLCWVDILGGAFYENHLATGKQKRVELATMVGAIAPRADHTGFAVAVADGFGLYDDAELTMADRVLPEPHLRMNDAKCDSAGRLWAGSAEMDFAPGKGRLHRWDGSGPSAVVADGLTLPNGLGWGPLDDVMYLVDSVAGVMLHAPYCPDAGEVGRFQPLLTIERCPPNGPLPDGLAVDTDGCVWLAMWGGSQVRRYSPRGALVGVVPMPVSQPSSCAFAEDGTLYITSARAGLTPQQLSEQPHAGSVFALPTTTRGVPVTPFHG